ncbi:BTAD domain-containing putative transcriptional regulator, partial [Streptomyces sp. NPDC059627]
VVDGVWGGAPPRRAAAALHAHVSHLRRCLEPEREARARGGVIVSEGAGYALRLAADAVDAWRFEEALRSAAAHADTGRPSEAVAVLESGLALWRGPAYAEYAAEPWAHRESARLAELRELARERLLAARLDRGEDAVLVPELESLVAEDPLREERRRLLALALYRAHRQADALDALRGARHLPPAGSGTAPGAALHALEAGILAQDPALDAPARRVPRPAPGTDLLVDRGPQLAELRDSLRSALDGRPRVVLIEGPAGIGKSRLLGEVAGPAAGERVTTLTATGSRREKDYGYGVVRQLFERVVSDREESLLAGAAVAAGAVFGAVRGPQPQSFAVLNALYELTRRLVRTAGPLVLAVDDLQWCDSGSVRYLAYLAGRLEGLPVLIAVTLRTGAARGRGAARGVDDGPLGGADQAHPADGGRGRRSRPPDARRGAATGVHGGLPSRHGREPAAAPAVAAGPARARDPARRRARRRGRGGRVAGGVRAGA